MHFRAKLVTVACGTALVLTPGVSSAAPPQDPRDDQVAVVAGVAEALDLTQQQARTRLAQQKQAHETFKALPKALVNRLAGHWFDDRSGQLTVAVASAADAADARAAGARAVVVDRSKAELDRLLADVRSLAGSHVGGLNSYGVDPRTNDVLITVNSTKENRQTAAFLRKARELGGVRVTRVTTSPVQQAGEVNPGDPWWPGGESNCSVGFARPTPTAASTSSRRAIAPTTPTSPHTASKGSRTASAPPTSAAPAA